MKKSLAVVLSFLMLLNSNISVLGAISAEAEKDVVVTQDENPLPDENQEPENLEFSEESEEMSIEEESEKDITENNTQSEEDVTDAEESETDSEEKEAVDSEGKSEPEESVSEPSEELNDESDSKNEADPKADNAEIDKTAEDGKDAEEFEEDEEISREDVEEDKTDEDAEGTEDAKLLASGNAVYYGEYGVWFDSVTHTITKGANRTSITIPSEIDGYIVSTIADYAFQNCYWLKSIDIPATVTNLGYKTFANCTSLQSITIPKTVTSGSYLFDGCTNLKEISFAAGTKSIPNSIINGCPAVEKINLPVGLLKLGDYAFANCAKLSSVTLPTTLTDMGQYTFKNCPALTSITIPKNVTAGSSLFNGCTNLTEVTFSAGAKSIPEKFLYASPAIINVNLPNGLMSLGEQAFACCYYLENITLPPSIIDLGNKTFFQCTSLKSITIPKNVTAGCDLFQECDSLREVIFASGIKRIPENFLRNAYNVESVKLPEGLLAIGDRAFMYCYALKNIVLPESLTDLGVESFNECVSLECITIPKNVSSGLDMFKKCTSLTKVVFAPGTKSIPIHFLRNAYNVKQIILPDGLLTIGDYAFDSCYNLSDIEIPSSVKNLGNMTFSNCVSLKTFTIPKNVEQYSSLFAGCTNLTEIFFEKGTVAIPDYAIEGAPVVKSIVIPEGVTTIGKCAFNGCTMLEKIVIPDTVTSIAPFWSFSSNCPLLKEITFPANACSDSDWYGSPFEYMSKVIFAEGTTKIPEYMFQGLKNHIEVYLPKSISEIPENTFENAYFVKLICNNEYAKNYAETHSITYEYNGEIHAYGINTNEKYKSQPPEIGTYYEKYKLYFDNSTGTITGGTNEITDLVIPESINGVIVEKIADNAFKNAVNLTSVSMPDTILTIGSEAFYNCIRLKSIVFSNGLYSMGTHVFDGCVSLEEVKLPSTLSDVLSDYPTDGNWFWNCKNLKKIVLTDGTTRILRNAFSCLPSLEMVIIPDSVTEIETGAFRNCYNLKNVVLPQELYSMGNGVFAGCISLEKITLPYSLTEGGGRWFSECYALKEITLSDGLSRIPAEAFYGTPVLESIIIPDTVTQIDEYAFAACNQLKSVSLSENLMGMGYRAFLMCQSLQEIKIPPNLTESYTSASQYKYAKGAWFENCYSLKKVTFEEGSTEIPSEALKYTFGMNEIVFPGTLSYINSNAFESCISLTEVTLPKSITSIASKAFCECRSLRSITIPMNISLLGSSYYESPFSKCTGLEKVIFSEGLKKIPDGAFNSVYSLKYIILPESVENISYKSFYNCISLKTIDYAGSPNSFKNIKIESGNDAIYNAAVICQKRNPVTTRESILRTVTLYAEVNLNTAASGNDNYVKSANVIATIGKKAYKPDENGKFVLPASGIAVFSADNYVSKSVSLNSVSNGTMIRLELKNDKDPIINEVMLEAVNIRSQTFKMSADYKGTIYASVNWNGCKEKAFYIENGNNIWKISNNKTEIIEFGNLINPNKKIFIVAVTANGQTYRKELHIQVEKAAPPEKMEVDIGANIPEIPADSIPYFGKDFKLKLNIPNFEASMSVKGDTATYIFGVDVAKYAKSKEYFLYDKGSKELYDKTTTTKDLNYAYDHLADLFKNTFSQMKYNHNNKKRLSEEYESLQKKLGDSGKWTTGKFAVDANFNVCGYAKMKYQKVNGSWKGTFMEGGVIFAVEAKVGFGGNFMVFFIPFNWEANVSGSIKAQLELARSQVEEALKAQGVIKGDIGVKIGAGPGFKKLHVNGCGEGKLMATFTSSQSGYDFLLDAELSAYFEFALGRHVHKLELARKTFNLYPRPSKSKSAEALLAENASLYDESSFELMGRDYLDNYPSEFVANNENAALMDEFLRTDSTIKTNVYRDASPVMVKTQNGNKLLVWLEDNMERNTANSTTLTYSYFSNGKWSEPGYVDDDGTADFNPVLKTVNGTTYLAWENAKTALLDEMSITETAKQMEIKYAIFDTAAKAFKNATALTNNEYVDESPVINSTKLGTVISWVTNEGDEYFTADTCHGISYALLEVGEMKDSGNLAENLSAIDSQFVYVNEDKLEAMYIVDTDGNLETVDDNVLRTTAWPEETLLEGSVSGISEWFGKTYCYKDNSLFASNDNLNYHDMCLAISNGDFILADNGNVVLFEESHDGVKDIFAYFYANNQWGNAVQITDLNAVIGNVTGYMNQGKLELSFMKGILAKDVENPQYYDRCDISTMTVSPSYNISLDGVFVDKAALVPGKTVKLSLDVTNLGEKAVNSVNVTMHNSGEQVLNEIVKVSILPGQKQEVTVDYLVPSNFVPFNADVEVSVSGYSDCDVSNNVYKVELSYTDISLDELTYSKISEEEWDINTAVSNLGFNEMKNVQILLKDENGELIDSRSIENLEPLETQGIVFRVSQTDIEYTVEVVSAENEDSIANNTRTIEIPGIPSQPEYTLGDLNGDGEVTDSDAIYLLYHTFFSEDYPLNQPSDFNGDGEVTDSDAVYLLYYTFFPDEYPLN